MKDEHILDAHHVSRYCTATRLTEQGKPAPAAFRMKAHEEYLSVDWLEFIAEDDRDFQININRKFVRKED